MKPKIYRFILLILLFINSILLNAKDTITVSWDPWPPHQSVNRKKELSGVNIELIKKIVDVAGFKIKFKKIPWKRGLKELEKGTVDVVMSAVRTKEREKYAYFSDSYFKLEYNALFIKTKDKKKFSKIKALKDIVGTKLMIGVTVGAIYSEEYEKLVSKKQLEKNLENAVEFNQNFQKLISNQIDGVIADELGGFQAIKNYGYEKKIILHFYLYGKENAESYLMYSKKSMDEEIVKMLNNSLKKIKTDGTYKKILNKYKLAN